MYQTNQVTLLGNVGNAEFSIVNENFKVLKLSVATNEKWTDKTGEKQEKVEWHNVECFNKTAENINSFIKKGSLVAIRGVIRYRSWEKDGVTKYATVIESNDIHVINTNSNGK